MAATVVPQPNGGPIAVLRPTPVVRASQFSWECAHGVAECSDLREPGGYDFFFLLSRVYDDSYDLGFTMVSDRSGREAVFCLEETLHDTEGEIQGWRFSSVRRPGIPPMTVTVFND